MTSQVRKVTDLINKIGLTYSFEITPDVKKDDVISLDADPAFYSVTWHAKSHKCKDLTIEPLKVAEFLRTQQKQVLMHLSCDMLKKEYLEQVLAFLQEKEICNLFLVLGESFDPSSSDFKSTLELIKYIREISGQFFCIGVAGFCECDDKKILILKEKIDAGADFIVTQAYFDADVYKNFVNKCNKAGIKVPIISGLFPFENSKQLINFTNMCKVKVSNDLLEYVKKNEGTELVGAEVIKNVIKNVLSEFPAAHIHFFTLNKINNVTHLIKDIQK